MINWFLSLSIKDKILTAVIGFLFIAYLTTSLKLSYEQYKYSKTIIESIEFITTEKTANEAKGQKNDQQGEKINKEVRERSKAIDKKLKQDEKTIDTTDISDDDIKRFITKHHKR